MTTRRYIGVTDAGPVVLHNVRRDDTGEPLLLIDQDAVETVRMNFSAWLETGETITSASVTAENCTASTSTATPNIDITLSAVTSYTDGKVTVIATASSGSVWRGIVRVRRTRRYTDEQRFRDYT